VQIAIRAFPQPLKTIQSVVVARDGCRYMDVPGSIIPPCGAMIAADVSRGIIRMMKSTAFALPVPELVETSIFLASHRSAPDSYKSGAMNVMNYAIELLAGRVASLQSSELSPSLSA
jgi:hypothetical protein